MYLALALFTFVVSGIACHYLAKARGLRPVFWGVMGFAFGPLVILIVLFASPANASH